MGQAGHKECWTTGGGVTNVEFYGRKTVLRNGEMSPLNQWIVNRKEGRRNDDTDGNARKVLEMEMNSEERKKRGRRTARKLL